MKMLVCHTPEGRINNIIFDPIPPGLPEHYLELGIPHALFESDLDGGVIISTHYVSDGACVPRPTVEATASKLSIAADGIDTAVISGIPSPIAVHVDGESHEVIGGEIEVSSDMPAVYKFSIDQWPFMPWSMEITAA